MILAPDDQLKKKKKKSLNSLTWSSHASPDVYGHSLETSTDSLEVCALFPQTFPNTVLFHLENRCRHTVGI